MQSDAAEGDGGTFTADGATAILTDPAAPKPVPCWLLDVDGVLVASWPEPGWGPSADHRRSAVTVRGQRLILRWAPALRDRIIRVIASGLVEVRWCSTWCSDADMVEASLGLPALAREWHGVVTAAEARLLKLAAVRGHLAAGRRVIWTDDRETPAFGPLYDELTTAGALLIRPPERTGLTPTDLDSIDRFVSMPVRSDIEAGTR